MKKTLTLVAIIFSLNVNAQAKKDSVTYLPDSVNTISVSDIQKLLSMVGDKISKNEGDAWQRAFQNLVDLTMDKRRKIIKQPK